MKNIVINTQAKHGQWITAYRNETSSIERKFFVLNKKNMISFLKNEIKYAHETFWENTCKEMIKQMGKQLVQVGNSEEAYFAMDDYRGLHTFSSIIDLYKLNVVFE